MEKKQPNLAEFYQLPNPGLRAYFQHTVAGNQDDYRPPFWKGKSREEVLSMWQKVFDTLGVKEKWPSLYDFEMEMKSKVGPLSIQAPLDKRIESIENYFTLVDVKSEPIQQEAIAATINFFGKMKGLRLRSKDATLKEMRLSTNSGGPFFGKRRRFASETLNADVVFDDKGVAYGDYNGKRYKLCATLGWRGQEGGIESDDVKQRVVWMMSFLLNLNELQFYQPAIKAAQRHNLIPAYVSMEAVDKEVTALFETKGADDDVICTDFSKFDQHFNSHMQEAALAIERGLSTPDVLVNNWFDRIYPIKFNLPLICSDEIAFFGSHGMGSGSGGTNFDECMAHKALQFDACLRAGTKLNPHSMAYGDDGILTAPGLKVEHVIQAYTSHGQEMNPEKQYVSKHDCVVLRRWHSTSYKKNGIMVGVYSTFRALGRLLGQERFYDPDVWGPIQVTLRALSIIENCNNSPYFEQFVDFVLTGDRYRLGLDIPGFYANLQKHVAEAIEQIPDFLGYTKTLQTRDAKDIGIMNWRVVQYLLSKQ